MILQERDENIIEFIKRFKISSTSQIEREFFKGNKQSARLARRRLKVLYDTKLVKRYRGHINMEYLYYHKKPQQIKHRLILVDFYQAISMQGRLIEFTLEKSMGELRPDAVCRIAKGNQLHIICAEIERSNNKFNQDKYEKFYRSREYRKYFEVFPKVIVICDRQINFNQSMIKYFQLPASMDGIERTFR